MRRPLPDALALYPRSTQVTPFSRAKHASWQGNSPSGMDGLLCCFQVYFAVAYPRSTQVMQFSPAKRSASLPETVTMIS